MPGPERPLLSLGELIAIDLSSRYESPFILPVVFFAAPIACRRERVGFKVTAVSRIINGLPVDGAEKQKHDPGQIDKTALDSWIPYRDVPDSTLLHGI